MRSLLFDGRHDLGDVDLGGGAPQPVAAGAAARALDQAGAAQAQEDLLQIGQRDLLALGDGRQRHGLLAALLGESAIAITAYRPLVFSSMGTP